MHIPEKIKNAISKQDTPFSFAIPVNGKKQLVFKGCFITAFSECPPGNGLQLTLVTLDQHIEET